MSQVLSMWRRLSAVPVVGARVFSVAFAQRAPYFATVRPRFTVIEPNRAELVIGDRRGVHNHIGTVHAIALCNGLEAAMGALAEASIPPGKRWIPKGMEVAYTAKATSDITCIAETDAAQWTGDDPDLPVRVRGVRTDGTVVIEGVIRLWVTPKPQERTTSTTTPTTAKVTSSASTVKTRTR
jgi:acyl-coenzyme A thioesterase PaaI-like protein